MAYSTWYSRPSGLKVVVCESYRRAISRWERGLLGERSDGWAFARVRVEFPGAAELASWCVPALNFHKGCGDRLAQAAASEFGGYAALDPPDGVFLCEIQTFRRHLFTYFLSLPSHAAGHLPIMQNDAVSKRSEKKTGAGAIIRKSILPLKIPEHQKTFLFGELCFVWAFCLNQLGKLR
jgi:hypothetical protein